MPANWSLFRSLIIPYAKKHVANTHIEAAYFVANAYNSSVVGSASNMYGQLLISGNTEALRLALTKAFSYGYTISIEQLPTANYVLARIIASGLVMYWQSAIFNPYPPAPPTISPLAGVVMSSGGVPEVAVQMIVNAMLCTETVTSVELLISAFNLHMATVSGAYFGLIPSPNGGVPSPPIPFVGVF